MKLCRTCGDTKPLEAFNKAAKYSDGRQTKCRDCQKAYVAANRERITQRAREKHEANPEIRKAATKKYREENADAIYERNKAYMDANREKQRGWVRKSYAKNHDKELARNRAKYERDKVKLRATRRAWRRANPAKVLAYWKKRAERVLAAGPDITGSEKLDLLAEHNWLCAYCKTKLSWQAGNIEFDHIVPIDSEGLNHKPNRVPACRKCNRRKWKHSLDTFIDSLANR